MRAGAPNSGSKDRPAPATVFALGRPFVWLPFVWLPLAWLVASGCDAWQRGDRADAKGEWSYGGETGPEFWAELSPDYSLCRAGRAQSPVDLLSGAVVDDRPSRLRVDYGVGIPTLVRTDRGLRVEVEGRHAAFVDGAVYWLRSLRWRTPSEHWLEGRRYPGELQLRHETDDGWVAVFAVLLEEGRPDVALDPILRRAELARGEQVRLAGAALALESLLPANRIVYRYDGSLTFPPCSEAVTWFVFAEPVELSRAQIETLRRVAMGNSRPVQALNDRALELGLLAR